MPWSDALIAVPLRRVLVAGLYGALAAATVVIVHGDPELALAGRSTSALIAELAVGALLLLAALSVWRPGARFPLLLAAAALAWPLTEWNTPGAGPGFTAGLVLFAAWPPLLTAAALRGPDERRLGRSATLVLALSFASTVGVLGVASAAVFDPRAEGCPQCPANLLLVAADGSSWSRFGPWGLGLGAASATAFAALAVGRLVRASPARRRLALPVLLPSLVAVGLFATGALHGLRRGYLSNDATDRALWAGEIAALAVVAGGTAWGRVRARRARSALSRLVVELGGSPSPGGLRERLAVVLGDPSLDLLYRRDDDAGWIDADGRPAAPPSVAGRGVTQLLSGGRRVCAIVHRPGLLDDPVLAEDLAVTARLAVEHERLQASRRADLEELRASRARIVARADAERRRLERDLHDGAQQRLVTLAIGIRLAHRGHADGDAALGAGLTAAELDLRAAVGELRELAHGLFPAALAEEGLAAAVEELAEQEPRLVARTLPAERCAPSVESAAYFLIGQALRLTSSGDVEVDVSTRDGRLVVELRAASGLALLPPHVADRVGAVGGALTVAPGHLRAELPCAS